MNDFVLDPRLARDTHLLAEPEQALLLLMDNALVQWLILVPRCDVREFHHLPPPRQLLHLRQLQEISLRLEHHVKPDKINTAAIGNIVSQLHIHVVARREGDYCWPGVVWGRPEREPWQPAQVNELAGVFADLR